jgi:hypothetical protein
MMARGLMATPTIMGIATIDPAGKADLIAQ